MVGDRVGGDVTTSVGLEVPAGGSDPSSFVVGFIVGTAGNVEGKVEDDPKVGNSLGWTLDSTLSGKLGSVLGRTVGCPDCSDEGVEGEFEGVSDAVSVVGDTVCLGFLVRFGDFVRFDFLVAFEAFVGFVDGSGVGGRVAGFCDGRGLGCNEGPGEGPEEGPGVHCTSRSYERKIGLKLKIKIKVRLIHSFIYEMCTIYFYFGAVPRDNILPTHLDFFLNFILSANAAAPSATFTLFVFSAGARTLKKEFETSFNL